MIRRTGLSGPKRALYQLAYPSFFGTFNLKVDSVFMEDYERLKEHSKEVEDLQKIFGKVSQVRYIMQCLNANLTPAKQLIIKRRQTRFYTFSAVSALLFLSVFLLTICYQVWSKDFSFLPPFIWIVCFLQSLLNTVKYAHRVKQISLGATFPRNYILSNYRNLIDLDGPLYLFRKVVFEPVPFMGEFYDKVVKLESEAKSKNEQ